MKRLLSILLVCILTAMSGTAAYAAGTGGGSGSGGNPGTGDTSYSSGQYGGGDENGYGQMEQNRVTIRAQHQELLQLRLEIAECGDWIRERIREMIREREQLDSGQMTQLRNALQNIRQERVMLQQERQGKIMEQVQLMREARAEGDIDSARQALERIREEQQLRLRDMERILEMMQELREQLGD